MKKIALLLTFAVATFAASAQVTLTGTTYAQNFDNLTTSGIPTGWKVYNTATSTSLGLVDLTYSNSVNWGAYYDTLDCPSDVFGTGFKNVASADNGYTMSTASCAVQGTQTNRALGVRQSSPTSHPGYDPGASFALELANTSGFKSFVLNFKLQSLDSISTRVTTWTLDYGIGSAPTVFTPITTTPAILTTGGNTFSNQAVTATLPAAINNQPQPVWIRISTLAASSGSGNRATSAIDDYSLSWSTTPAGVTNVSAQQELGLTVIGNATSDNVKLSYTTETAGNYSLMIYDITGRTLHTETVNAQSGVQYVTVNGLHLAPGMYFAKMSNSNGLSVARIMVK